MRLSGILGRSVSRPRSRSSAIASERWTSSAVNGFIRQPSARSGIGKRGALPLTNRHGDAKVVEPHRDRKTGRAVRQMEIEQDEVGVMLLGRGDRAVGIVGDRDHAVARIVLDQIFERCRQLRVVFDDQDPKHPRASPSSTEIPAGKSVTWMLARMSRVRIPRERS